MLGASASTRKRLELDGHSARRVPQVHWAEPNTDPEAPDGKTPLGPGTWRPGWRRSKAPSLGHVAGRYRER